jgi:hypothetical protein
VRVSVYQPRHSGKAGAVYYRICFKIWDIAYMLNFIARYRNWAADGFSRTRFNYPGIFY